MKQILQDLSSGETLIVESPAPMLLKGSLKIATKVSLISAGTERMLVEFAKSSYIDKARKQPEKVKMVLDKVATDGLMTTYDAVKSKLRQPIPLGYSNVGVVEEISLGNSGFHVGDRVVSNGAHADIVTVKNNLCARIPDNVDDDSAVFTVVGSIGLQGVRLANPTLGESFVVVGAGLIGLLVIQLLKANGCRVLAIDFDEQKLKLATQFGAEICNPLTGGDVLAHAAAFSRDRGVDGVIITASTQSNQPMKQAAQMCRKRGRIILVGVVGLELERSDFYEKEISFQVSCSYGPGRYDSSYEDDGNDYPIGYVRWTEQRNFEAFLDLVSAGVVDVKPLISSRFEFTDASTAYKELSSNTSGLGIILDYNLVTTGRVSRSITLDRQDHFAGDSPTIGFIGAGNYASRILIPAFKGAGVRLHTLVTANGVNSFIHGKKGGFLKASTDVLGMLAESEVNTVVIATQHNTHSKYVIDSLNANKNVWVEKPLAIDKDSLSLIKAAYSNAHSKDKGITGPQLIVGFNRRFAPQIQKMHELLSCVMAPKSIVITVNAGFVPKDHWTQDPLVGGGRIVGECCHFIDLMRFLVGQKIVSVSGRSMVAGSTRTIMEDRSSITLGFEDGSFGTILYLANGASNFPKERIEVFADSKVLQLDNFRKLKGYGWKGFKKLNLWMQDKGQQACPEAFIKGIRAGIPCIPADEIFEVARVTIEANDILLDK
ncbi:bi-domain-containing oxidoreductase [Alphaproteobacteria bacterium]|nr:bi-domain-containing oxidoreductase [Alphaproteobacteria bacterium]